LGLADGAVLEEVFPQPAVDAKRTALAKPITRLALRLWGIK
jgi:hypothetical protein